MKTNSFSRFFSIFLLLLLLVNLLAVPAAAAVPDPDIQAKAALLVDQKTGAVVYAKNEHQELYPASLTKIMTALLVLEAVDRGTLKLDQPITATASAMTTLAADGSTAGIQVGEVLTVEQLLYCMLVVSANEACTILAEQVSGSVGAFVDAMNAKAEDLGCEHTHFMNPHGLHDDQHYTSAWDLYLITRAAMEYPEFMTVCDTTSTTIPATNLSPERILYNTNYLICGYRSRGYLNGEAHGVKTGSTSLAGHCLVSTARRASLSFVSVILGADRTLLEDGTTWWTYSFGETNRLFDWAFENFTYRTILKENDVAGEAPVSLSRQDHVTLHTDQPVEILVPQELNVEDLEKTITLRSDPVEAPIAAGDVLGTLSVSLDGKEYASVDLLAFTDVEASRLRVLWRDIQNFLDTTQAKVGGAVLGTLAALCLLWKLVFSRRRYRYGRSVGRTRSGYRGRRR